MANTYTINISDGTGSEIVSNGTYNLTVSSTGYDNSTINPSSITVDDNTNTFSFTLSASGTLIIHVTEDGTSSGVAVVGATFYRCDSVGNTYGSVVTTDSDGNATLNNLPYATSGAPIVYYKQTGSDSTHNYDDVLESVILTQSPTTIEVENPPAVSKTFNMTDANYSGLNIGSSTITLSE